MPKARRPSKLGSGQDELEAAQGAALLEEAMGSLRAPPKQPKELTAVLDTLKELKALDSDEVRFIVRDYFNDPGRRELLLAALGEEPRAAKEWLWESQDPRAGSWVPYDPDSSRALDGAYARGEKRCDVVVGGRTFTVDFSAQQQYNQQKAARPVRRRRLARFDETFLAECLTYLSDDFDNRPGRSWRQSTEGPSLDEGRRLVDAVVRSCGPSQAQLYCACCTLLRNGMLSMAKHLTAHSPKLLEARPPGEYPPLFHAVRNNYQGAVAWLVNAGQKLSEIASEEAGIDSVLSYAHSCNSGSAEWLLREYPESATVEGAPPQHEEALQLLRQRARERDRRSS